jgi:hypothetical protein
MRSVFTKPIKTLSCPNGCSTDSEERGYRSSCKVCLGRGFYFCREDLAKKAVTYDDRVNSCDGRGIEMFKNMVNKSRKAGE